MLLSQLRWEDLPSEKVDEILFSGRFERAEKSDYAIVLGTAPQYAESRAEIAAHFYRAGNAPQIIVSGAAVSDANITESAFLRGELIKRGVPEEAIIEESRAYDTIQNMTCSLTEICKRADIMEVGSVTVITEPFHIRRALYLAGLLLPKFIRVCGYTEGTERQRAEWKRNDRLKNCVRTEILILQQLIAKGRIEDIEL